MIPNIGPLEIGVLLIVALIVFGPRRLPELGNSLGRSIREFRNTVTDVGGDKGQKSLEKASPQGDPVAEQVVEPAVRPTGGS
jgi:sec-independent protein translocase protein TatA